MQFSHGDCFARFVFRKRHAKKSEWLAGKHRGLQSSTRVCSAGLAFAQWPYLGLLQTRHCHNFAQFKHISHYGIRLFNRTSFESHNSKPCLSDSSVWVGKTTKIGQPGLCLNPVSFTEVVMALWKGQPQQWMSWN